MPTINEAIKAAIEQLDEINATDTPRLDAEVLLAFVMQRSRASILASKDDELSEFELTHFKELIDDRARLYPVAYMIGEKEFWSMALVVSEKALIPRPDTELLVERALLKGDNSISTLLDLGTGCGAIALALAKELPDCKVTATDFSSSALELAELNKARQQAENVVFKQADWFFSLEKKSYDLIVSNPPYIDPEDAHLEGEVRYEPQSALVALDKGISDLAFIINNAMEYLTTDGWLLLEHGFDQADRVRSLMRAAGYANVHTTRDLGGNERVTEGQLPVLN